MEYESTTSYDPSLYRVLTEKNISASLGTDSAKIINQKTLTSILASKADLTNPEQAIRMGITHTNSIHFGDEEIPLEAKGGELYFKGNRVTTGPSIGSDITIVQTPGQDSTVVMSQKATTDAIKNAVDEVLYEQYYYPNVSQTTDTVRFSDSTEILQPTNFIRSYTDAGGESWTNVFECKSFPDWFDFAEKNCSPYGNGISVAYLFFKNYTVKDNKLVYNFYDLQDNNIKNTLPYSGYKDGLGIKKIDSTHFKVYNNKDGSEEFEAFNTKKIDCSLFAFSSIIYNPIYDIDGYNKIRITLTGNFQSPSRYNTLINSTCDIGLFGYNYYQVLYGEEYIELEIDKENNRYRQVKSGFSMWKRTSQKQNWSNIKPECYNTECMTEWLTIRNEGTPFTGVFSINGKNYYGFSNYSNPYTILLMGCKIKIEKIA